MKNYQPPASAALPTELIVPGAALALEVNITAALASVDVMPSWPEGHDHASALLCPTRDEKRAGCVKSQASHQLYLP